MQKKAIIGTCVASILLIISMIGAMLVQTSAGKVYVNEIKFDTSFGYQMSALIYQPKTATESDPAPGIIAVHGMYNNKEMQDSNLVELSRRGFVVMAVDMFSHGDSELLPDETLLPMSGLAALQYFTTLPYVDQTKIGMTGHSMGGLNCDLASQMGIAEDGSSLVSALFLNCCFATYTDENGNFSDLYGDKAVAVLADRYDEFLFQEVNSDGTELLAKDYILSDKAQSFLHFGADPQGKDVRAANTFYHSQAGEGLRIIYTPSYTHPWSHFSKLGTKYTVEFFTNALEAETTISSDNQIWQWKEAFNFLGLIAFALFLHYFSLLLLHTRYMQSFIRDIPSYRTLPSLGKKAQRCLMTVITLLIAGSYIPITTALKGDTNGRIIFAQNSTFAISVWALFCGIMMFVLLRIAYRNKSISTILESTGIKCNAKEILIGLSFSITIIVVGYLWLLFADIVFKTDFRIWFLAAKTVTPKLFLISLFPYFPLFFVFFFASTIFSSLITDHESDKIGVLYFKQIIVSVLPIVLLLSVQYITLFSTGEVLFSVINESSAHSMILWLFPLILLLPASSGINHSLYSKTGNPYIPAMITSFFVTLITCANTSSWL